MSNYPNQNSKDKILYILNLKNINVEGIFSHLALTSYADNLLRLNKFKDLIDFIQKNNYNIDCYHICDSISGVDYDYSWKAKRNSVIATLPFSYADGYPRNIRDKGEVTINGTRVPIIGVICMDQCIEDITNLANIEAGREITDK